MQKKMEEKEAKAREVRMKIERSQMIAREEEEKKEK